jgi:hypothetical protein
MFGWQVAVEVEWFNGQAWADLPRVPRQRTGGAATVPAGSFIKVQDRAGKNW